MELTYNPAIFEPPDFAAAREVILTPEGGHSSGDRWERETPYLTELLDPQYVGQSVADGAFWGI